MSNLTKREDIYLSILGALIGCADNPDLMIDKIARDAKLYTDKMIATLNIKNPDK